MNKQFLKHFDQLNEEQAVDLMLQQPGMQILQAIEQMPESVILQGSEAIFNFFKEYFKDNPAILAQIDAALLEKRNDD